MAAYVQDAIMLLGDSITEMAWENNGFALRLAYVYNRKMDVLNRGFGGYNTEWAIPILHQSFAAQHEQAHVPKIRLLTIWLGANDAALPGSVQHLPLPTYRANLAALVRTVTSPASPRYSPHTRVIVFTPPPVNTRQWGAHRTAQECAQGRDFLQDRDFAVTRAYADAAKDVARAEGVAALDVWTAFWEAAGEDEARLSELLSDGLHLNERGYAIVFDLLIKTIKDSYPEIYHENLGTVFATWDEIDFENPLSSLKKRDIFKDVSS